MKKYFMRFLNFKENLYDSFMTFFGVFCICLVCCIACAQILLKIDSSRNMITSADILDGALLAGSDGLVDKGSITLSVVEGEPSDELLVLINGEEYGKILSEHMDIDITSQAVVEIRNMSKKAVTVELTSVSDNLEAVLNNERIEVDGIEVLCRVIFKN